MVNRAREKNNDTHFEVYMPEVKSLGDTMSLNFEYLIKVESNLKLNLIDKDGKSLIAQDEKYDEEIHYMRMESVISTYELRISTIFKLLKEAIRGRPTIDFKEWTLTDFDNHLNGNPHTHE